MAALGERPFDQFKLLSGYQPVAAVALSFGAVDPRKSKSCADSGLLSSARCAFALMM